MGLGHVPPRPLREAGQGDDLPRCQHRGVGADDGYLTGRAELAQLGESIAASFLTRRGATVVARNLSVGRGEVDLLVRFGGRHVAVEVKTVGRWAVADDPIERMSEAKLAQVRRLANRLSPHCGTVGVDFVGVEVGKAGVTVNWRRNVA